MFYVTLHCTKIDFNPMDKQHTNNKTSQGILENRILQGDWCVNICLSGWKGRG